MLPILSIPFHYPWLKITSKQTAWGCSCKQNVGMSRRNYHKHDPAPLFLCIRSTTGSCYTSDHKNHGHKKPGKRQSDGLPCLDKAVLVQGRGGGGGGTHRFAKKQQKASLTAPPPTTPFRHLGASADFLLAGLHCPGPVLAMLLVFDAVCVPLALLRRFGPHALQY